MPPFYWLFDTSGFPARWQCGDWTPALGWLHILSDLGVWSAYFAIPLVLGYFLARRGDLPFRGLVWLFAAFILLCGTTHLLDAAIFWWPAYRLAAVVKFVTAAVSWVTVAALIRVMPQVMSLRSPEDLEKEIARRTAALAESEGRFKAVFEAAPSGLLMADRDGRIVLVNEVFVRMFGWEKAELIGQPVERLLPERHHQRHLAHRASYFAAPEGRPMGSGRDLAGRRKDGSEFPVEVGLTPLSRDGALYVLASVIDITSRKQAEEARSRLSVIVESADDAIFTQALDGTITSWNAGAERMFGHPAADAVGRHIRLIVPPELEEERVGFVARLAIGEVVRSQTVRMASGGRLIDVSLSITPLRNSAGLVTEGATILRDISDLKKAEALLRESEERSRLAREGGRIGVYDWDVSTGRSIWTAEQEAIYGLTPGAFVGGHDDWVGRIHPADRERVLAEIESTTSERQEAAESEYRIVLPDGETRWVSNRSRLTYAGDGRLVRVVGVTIDMTKLKRTEAAIRESEARFRNLINSLPDAMFLNVGGRVAFCNPACLRLFGATDESQIIGKTPFDLHPPDQHDSIRSRIDAMRTTGGPAPDAEETVLRLDGATTPVQVTALPITDQGAAALLVVLRDLAEQKRLQRQLRQQELMLREAAELAHVGGWGFDPVTLEGDWTAETARIHDLEPTAEATVSQGLSHFEGDDRACIEAAVAAAIMHGTPYDLELRFTSAKGARKWVRSICRPLIEGGKVIRVRGSLQDITERKKAEAEILALNADLEGRVRARTAELEAANRELDAFSYSVSHDLRAPLRAIDGFSRILAADFTGALPDEAKEYLRDIRMHSRQMGRLIDDLLAFSRLGRSQVRRETVDIDSLVGECLAEIQAANQGRSVEVRVTPLPPCQADGPLLKQVWLNLLANAFKYSSRRDPAVIEVGHRAGTDGPAYFVKDNGVGFDMRYAHKLFGVFQRLHRAEDYEGTGVGLAIVQRVVHRHGGRAWAESEPEKGATFYFTIPGGPGDA